MNPEDKISEKGDLYKRSRFHRRRIVIAAAVLLILAISLLLLRGWQKKRVVEAAVAKIESFEDCDVYFLESRIPYTSIAYRRRPYEIRIVAYDLQSMELSCLSMLPQVEKIVLFGTTESDAAMQRIAEMPNLRELDISHADITADGLRILQNSRSLHRFSLGIRRDAPGITEEMFETILSMSHLEQLSLNGRFDAQHLSILCQHPRIKSLAIQNNGLGDEDLEHLEQLTFLEHLRLGVSNISENGYLKLKAALPEVDIDYTAPLLKQ